MKSIICDMTHCRFTLRGGSCDADFDTAAADSCERYGGVSSGRQGCECMCTQDNNTISVIGGVRCIHTLSGKVQHSGVMPFYLCFVNLLMYVSSTLQLILLAHSQSILHVGAHGCTRYRV